MLEFWFNPEVKSQHKWIFLAILVAVIGTCYALQPLSPIYILLFMGTGIIFLICRYCQQHFDALPQKFRRILHWIPIACLLTLLLTHLTQSDQTLIYGVQGIAWMAFSVCCFSPRTLLKSKST